MKAGGRGPRLIVGLGNPGSRYEETRHNVGFRIVQRWAQGEGIAIEQKGFFSLWAKGTIGGVETLFLLPQTMMNRSGPAVREAKEFYKVSDRDLLIVHDDLDLPLGRVKLDWNAGPAGHRGVSSVVDALGSKEFFRVRVGIGRPVLKEGVEEFVLSPFEKAEKKEVQNSIDSAVTLIREWIVKEGE